MEAGAGDASGDAERWVPPGQVADSGQDGQGVQRPIDLGLEFFVGIGDRASECSDSDVENWAPGVASSGEVFGV